MAGYWQTIGTGSLTDVNNIRAFENQLAEGTYGKLQFHLRAALPASVVSSMESQIKAKGVILTGHITQMPGGSTILNIPFQKAIAPLVIILAIVLAVIALLLISWAVLKWISTSPAATAVVSSITAAAFIAGLILLIVIIKRRY